MRRPAIYELRAEKSLADVLELAGGLLPAAALRHLEVQRTVAHDKQTMLSLEIQESQNPAEITRALESFEIQDEWRPHSNLSDCALQPGFNFRGRPRLSARAVIRTAPECGSPMCSLPTRTCFQNRPPITRKSSV